ncbi:Mcr1p [Sugiyamaella lignohabitans]|uniref:Mcr1p n=1 Tax=Sugiyamaella lignohabitans TaxID=796027 RepID=A0A167E869_9ASCO|nr:Mcr1p [Sugiyamaella lignohabitans]ANB13760.1 Mcr1p [Sugiyamaella lignohabitans]
MSTHIHGLKPNDVLSFKGPLPKYQWTPNAHKEIALLGGGTGITPLYQLLQAIHKDPNDKTKVNLFYANVTKEDVLIRDEIEALIKDRPDQFKVTYFLDKPPSGWTGETGYISKEFLSKNLPKPDSENIKIFVCGPPPFYNALSGPKVSPQDQGELTGALKELGYNKDQVYKF